MVKRSKATPLQIEIGSGTLANPYFRSNDVVQFTRFLVNSQSMRLRTLTIFGEDIRPLIEQLTAYAHFPSLKFLHIENNNELPIALPVTSLATHAPNLRELCVISVLLQGLPSIQFEYLTYFELQSLDTPVMHGSLQTWDLLNVFRCMPALQHLYITDAFPDSDPPGGLEPVELASSLETLTLASRRFPDSLVSFSSMLLHPSAFRDFEFSTVRPDVLQMLLSAHVGEQRPPKSLYLEMDWEKERVVFSASFTPWPPSDGNAPTPLNDVSVNVGEIGNHMATFLNGVCLREVVDLTFMDDKDTSARERWGELSAARAVRHLRVIGIAALVLFDMLPSEEDPATRMEVDAEDEGMFPAIDGISVIEMTEHAPHLGENALYGADKLLRCLRERRERGKPIRDLKVPDRLLVGDWLDPIRQEVEKVGGSRPRFY
jgi:hypothetical protein